MVWDSENTLAVLIVSIVAFVGIFSIVDMGLIKGNSSITGNAIDIGASRVAPTYETPRTPVLVRGNLRPAIVDTNKKASSGNNPSKSIPKVLIGTDSGEFSVTYVDTFITPFKAVGAKGTAQNIANVLKAVAYPSPLLWFTSREKINMIPSEHDTEVAMINDIKQAGVTNKERIDAISQNYQIAEVDPANVAISNARASTGGGSYSLIVYNSKINPNDQIYVAGGVPGAQLVLMNPKAYNNPVIGSTYFNDKGIAIIDTSTYSLSDGSYILRTTERSDYEITAEKCENGNCPGSSSSNIPRIMPVIQNPDSIPKYFGGKLTVTGGLPGETLFLIDTKGKTFNTVKFDETGTAILDLSHADLVEGFFTIGRTYKEEITIFLSPMCGGNRCPEVPPVINLKYGTANPESINTNIKETTATG